MISGFDRGFSLSSFWHAVFGEHNQLFGTMTRGSASLLSAWPSHKVPTPCTPRHRPSSRSATGRQYRSRNTECAGCLRPLACHPISVIQGLQTGPSRIGIERPRHGCRSPANDARRQPDREQAWHYVRKVGMHPIIGNSTDCLRGTDDHQMFKEAAGFRAYLSTRSLFEDRTSSQHYLIEVQILDRTFEANRST